jgi:hypothetical protein
MYYHNTFYEYSTQNCGMGVHKKNRRLGIKQIKTKKQKTQTKKQKTQTKKQITNC